LAFEDLDGDGRRGLRELLLAGVTVKLTHLRSGVFTSWTTDGTNDPDYCWAALTDGDYSLAVSLLPVGLVVSGPREHRFTVPFPGDPAHYEFGARRPDLPTPTPEASATPAATSTPTAPPTETPQPTVTGPSGEICAGAFLDADGSGAREAGERLLAGVRVEIDDEARERVREVLTRADAAVCSRLPVGVY
jgi:hypothetical protein